MSTSDPGSADFYTQAELAAEVRRLRYLYPDGQKWYHRLWLRWLLVKDQEEWALTNAAWKQIKEEEEEDERTEQ